jgi:DinB family protein
MGGGVNETRMDASTSRRSLRLARLLEDHRAAVQEFLDKADAVNETQWFIPRAEGKWTPAQEVRHVILAYETFIRDLGGGTPMALIGTPFKRRIWRLLGLSQILWRKRIPVAVRAPREVRPPEEPGRAGELLPVLMERAESFDRTFIRVWEASPEQRVTHAYFGALSLEQAISIATVHTRHHAAFLPSSRVRGPVA